MFGEEHEAAVLLALELLLLPVEARVGSVLERAVVALRVELARVLAHPRLRHLVAGLARHVRHRSQVVFHLSINGAHSVTAPRQQRAARDLLAVEGRAAEVAVSLARDRVEGGLVLGGRRRGGGAIAWLAAHVERVPERLLRVHHCVGRGGVPIGPPHAGHRGAGQRVGRDQAALVAGQFDGLHQGA
eukprot:3333546-Rhodomonas_salina.3